MKWGVQEGIGWEGCARGHQVGQGGHEVLCEKHHAGQEVWHIWHEHREGGEERESVCVTDLPQ